MIVTAILDPSALDQKYLNDKAYLIQARQFLSEIWTNGLLISDRENVLVCEMIRKVISKSSDTDLRILIEEIVKNKRQRIVLYKALTSSQDVQKICCELEHHRPPDVVVAGPDHVRDLQNCCSESKVITFSEYSGSEFEREIKKYQNWLPPIHELSYTEREDLFVRVVRFAKYIRIYDKQIGKGGNMKGFLKGLGFILALWEEHGYFQSERKVEIYTCAKKHAHQYNARENKEAMAKVQAELVDKLKARFELCIKLHVKDDRENEFHARYLQTQSTILLMERGFDIMKAGDGNVKKTEVRLSPNAAKHLDEFRRHADALL